MKKLQADAGEYKDGKEGPLQVRKKDSIRGRLRRTFLLLTILIIMVMCTFSLIFFFYATKRNAENLIRNKIQLAAVFMEAKKDEVSAFARQLTEDRALQIGLDLNNPERISSYLFDIMKQNPGYYITVFSSQGSPLADIGDSSSVVFTNRKSMSISEQILLKEGLKGNAVTDAILVTNGLQEKFPGYVAVRPVRRNNNILGVVLVRFLFPDNTDFFNRLAANLESELAIYVDGEASLKTADLSISLERYTDVANLRQNYEDINMTGDGLHEFRGIFSNGGNPIAVLHIALSSMPYMKVFITALSIYVALAIVMFVLVGYVIVKVSNTIIHPLEQLLQSVNVVSTGNLAHEIILTVKDEIGRLALAFNKMRIQLRDKISTIEEMNSSLEQTIEERTQTINTLNENMRHYLSPQLYASIAGGERDASIGKHYRKKLTIFFSDVVNFTATTDSLEPEDLSTLLNSYLDSMAQIAFKYGGTIDKYVGDAVMVFFGDPEFTSDKDHALRAVKMGMEMVRFMVGFRQSWARKGLANPFHVRMGINTGYCTIGNFGSESKMDYTIIGNNVNLAARYEAAAKPDTILLSPDTYRLIKDEIECKVAGTYELKGIPHPVKAYTPVRLKGREEKIKVLKLTKNQELLFPDAPMDLKHMNPEEKHLLLKNIKAVFTAIKKQDKK